MPQWNLTTAEQEEKQIQQYEQEIQTKGERNKVKETGRRSVVFALFFVFYYVYYYLLERSP